MFFFGNISTFLPYLLYISVVWICVLIGFRGHFFTGFLSLNKTENTTTVDLKENNNPENCYILNARDEENTDHQIKSICNKNKYIFFSTTIKVNKYNRFTDKFYQFLDSSEIFLRGPPSFLS